MGLILQNQLERALVKTKGYIDKKIEKTPEICYLSDYGIPSYFVLNTFNGKEFYLNDISKIPKLVNIVKNNPNKIYVLPYYENGQGYISSLTATSPAPNAVVFRFFTPGNGVEAEYLSINITSGWPYILVSKQPYQRILKSGINIKTINGKNILGGGNIEISGYDDTELREEIAAVQPMISVTWAELKEMRDNAELKSGQQYRITDYVTTTAQENTRSAGHPFDVIVTADSAYKLNEVARACLHEGDTYFSNAEAKLESWQIWYCLDNDAERFAWASNRDAIYNGNSIYYRNPSEDILNNDLLYYAWYNENEANVVYTIKKNPTEGEIVYDDVFGEDWEITKVITNGKGVIYRMIDEFGNDCPYDFKNIQFKRNLNFDDGYAVFSEDGEETWVYTFAGQSYHIDNEEWSGMLDGSLESPFGHMSDEGRSTFHSNIIKPYIKFYDDINDDRTKVGIRYLNDNVFLGTWEEIGSTNEEDAPYYYPYGCFSNSFGNNCYSNTFGNGFHSNTFGNDCYSNTFGDYCSGNTFGNSSSYNTFGNNCSSNIFGNSSSYNTFGDDYYSNTFGNNCSSNTFGNACSYNTFGNACSYNTFGNSSSYNTFGNDCSSNSFYNSSGLAGNVQCNIIENGVDRVTFRINKQSGAYGNIQYYHVYMGVQNTTVNVYDNNKYEMGVACDQQGNVHTFCIMDFKNS